MKYILMLALLMGCSVETPYEIPDDRIKSSMPAQQPHQDSNKGNSLGGGLAK